MDIPCPICNHIYADSPLTTHHLIPKSMGGRKGPKIEICSYCHSHIHDLFTEKELAKTYNTLESILSTEEMQRWIKWIKKRKPNGKLRRKQSNRRK